MPNEELKPCPFCGIKKKVEVGQDDMFYVECLKCGAKTDVYLFDVNAISAWNTRPSPWVPVTRRLPVGIKDERTPYLVKTIDVYGVALWREYDSGWDWESDSGEVVKWMPIP